MGTAIEAAKEQLGVDCSHAVAMNRKRAAWNAMEAECETARRRVGATHNRANSCDRVYVRQVGGDSLGLEHLHAQLVSNDARGRRWWCEWHDGRRLQSRLLKHSTNALVEHVVQLSRLT